jgi:hypothetical protein
MIELRQWGCIRWDGTKIDVPRAWAAMSQAARPESMLREILMITWEEGYARGFEAGDACRDPDEEVNPYLVEGVGDE